MKPALFACACFAALTPAPRAEALICIPLLGCDCDVEASPLNFGAYQPLTGEDATSTADIDVACNGIAVLPSVEVRLNAGDWGAFSARAMKGDVTGQLLTYNLYTTPSYTTVWGDGTSGTSVRTLTGGSILGGHWSATAVAHGRITGGQNKPPDTYRDTIRVTIIF